jgi:hypothetical protein
VGAGEAREGWRGKLSQAISTETIGIQLSLANRANQDVLKRDRKNCSQAEQALTGNSHSIARTAITSQRRLFLAMLGSVAVWVCIVLHTGSHQANATPRLISTSGANYNAILKTKYDRYFHP